MVRLTGEGWFDQPDVIADLKNHGYEYDKDYIIMHVPNIVNITYGRDVGYDIEQEHLGEEIGSISVTEIRSKRENLKE